MGSTEAGTTSESRSTRGEGHAASDLGQGGHDDQPKPRSPAEWVTLAVSVIAIVLLIGAAVYEEFARDEPPGVRVTIELDLEHADVRDGVTYVPYAVSNDGAKAAENVVVHFEIRRGDEIVEESSADIAFLPNGGVVNGELATELELAQYTVEARLGTLQLP